MKLELCDKTLDDILKLRDRDISARDASLDMTSDEILIVVPGTYEELRQFISRWLPLCLEGARERVEKFKRALKRRNFLKGYGLSDDMTNHMVARFVAGMKLEQVEEQYRIMEIVHREHLHAEFMGYTYLHEIAIVMQKTLEHTVEIDGSTATVAAYDDLRAKY